MALTVASEQSPEVVDHRRGHQVIALKCRRRVRILILGAERQVVGTHDRAHHHVGFVDQQRRQGKRAEQFVGPIDDEYLVGVVGELRQAAQIAQDGLERHVVANPHHFEIHDGADRAFRIAHRFDEARALLDGQAFLHLADDIGRQVGCDVRQFVGVHALGGRHEILAIH